MICRRALLFTVAATALLAQSAYVPVDTFDPARDAARDIREAVAEAVRTGRNVLVDVGGEWCVWCHYMDAFYEKHPDVKALRDRFYVQVKLNYSPENENKEILSKYPKISGYPHLFVLDGTGKLLWSQNTGKLEQGEGYNTEKFIAFLTKWAPQR